MASDAHTSDDGWQPAQPNKSSDSTRAQSGDEQPDDVMLTKLANLLDDVTEQNHVAQPTNHVNAVAEGADLPAPTPAMHKRAPKGPRGAPEQQQGKDSPLRQTSSGLNPSASGDHSAISIKGRADGIAIEMGPGDWETLLGQLDARLEQAANFFRGGEVALHVGARQLDERDVDAVRKVLQKYALRLNLVRTASERTFEAVVNLGYSAALEGAEQQDHVEAVVAESNIGGQRFFIFRGNLRSGQVLRKTESIIVIGDVNPGAQVVSAGDILVWGRLRGMAHAGAEGNLNAIVCAMSLEPTQLRVASYIAASAEQARPTREPSKSAEIAFIQDNALTVRPWNEAKRGFRSVFLG